MNPIVWMLLSIVINRSNAQYGPYGNVIISGYNDDRIAVYKVHVPDVPNGQAMIGSRMIVDGQYYEILSETISRSSYVYYYWTVSPNWAKPGGRFNVQFVPPNVDLEFVAWDPATPLAVCQGDCDYDSDCEGNMKCFENVIDESFVPPGCSGNAVSSADYCYSPAAVPAFSVDNSLQWLGWIATDLTACQGDCNNDNDCQGDLICVYDQVPKGCSGTVVVSSYNGWRGDYCGDRNLEVNVAAVEGNDGEEFEGSEDDTEGLAENVSNADDSELLLLPIGAVAIIMVIIGVVFMVKRDGKNKAKGQEKEMNKVVDATNVVHVQEVSNETADAMDAEEAGQERTAAV